MSNFRNKCFIWNSVFKHRWRLMRFKYSVLLGSWQFFIQKKIFKEKIAPPTPFKYKPFIRPKYVKAVN